MSSFNRIALVTVILAGAGGVARADGVQYRLEKDSFYHVDHCVGPCNCMPWSEEGPLSGTFVLTLDHEDPIYAYYAVSEVAWHVDGDMGPIDLGGTGEYQFGGEVAVVQSLTLDLSDGETPDHLESGLVPPGAQFPEIVITVKSSDKQCSQAKIDIHAVPAGEACYADCDGNGGLDLFDFLCFVNAFNVGDVYADCDGSGGLDLFDFLCFVNLFNVGC